MTTIQAESQKLNPSAMVELFRLDTSFAGGPMLYFIQGAKADGPVVYGGIEYTPVDIEFEGMEVSGSSALPTPVVRIANVGGLPQTLINTYGDLTGCKLKRYRTFARYLDDGIEPDTSAVYGPDTFKVERKVSENHIYIEWELSAAFDQQGKQVPGRTVIRDTCLWRYREHVSGATFNYDKAQCSHSEPTYFDENDVATTAANDKCGRTVNSCKLRFGANKPLPFGGFPGAARARF